VEPVAICVQERNKGEAMISADTVLMLVRAIHDGESHARWIDKPLTCVGQNCTFAVVGGLFNGWRLTWHHAKPYGFVAMVQTPLNDIGGFDDWHEDECENPVDDLLESEYRRFVAILSKARKFTGFQGE